jgi:hypothetical protein
MMLGKILKFQRRTRASASKFKQNTPYKGSIKSFVE